MAEPQRRMVSRLLVAVVTAMAVAWLVLLVDLLVQQRWLDVVLLLVTTALVAVAYVVQRRSRPFTS